MAYIQVEPFGEEVEDFRIARISSLLVNLAKGIHGKKDAKMSSPGDFMPNWARAVDGLPEQSLDDMKNLLKGLSQAGKRPRKKIGTKQRIPASVLRKRKEAERNLRIKAR